MENTNRILKYLFGELTDEELQEFKLDLQQKPELAKQTSDLGILVDRIRTELDMSGRTDPSGKEEIIATILAEYDISTLGINAVSKDEIQFERALKSAMQQAQKSSGRRIRRITIFTLAAAASLALTIAVLFPERDFDNMLISSYHPVSDIFGEEKNHSVRSELDNGILLLEKGDYIHARLVFEANMELARKDTSLMLLYAISLFETSADSMALDIFEQLTGEMSTKSQLDAAWYKSILLFRIGQDTRATEILNQISSKNSYYASAARRMLQRWEKEQYRE